MKRFLLQIFGLLFLISCNFSTNNGVNPSANNDYFAQIGFQTISGKKLTIIDQNLACVLDDSLIVVDISDDENPQIHTEYSFTGENLSDSMDNIFIGGESLLVLDNDFELRSIYFPLSEINYLDVQNDLLYLAEKDGLEIVNISNNNVIEYLGAYTQFDGYSKCLLKWPYLICINNDYLEILNVSDKDFISEVYSKYFFDIIDVEISDEFLYLLTQEDLKKFSFNDIDSIQEIDNYGYFIENVYDLEIFGKYAFIASSEGITSILLENDEMIFHDEIKINSSVFDIEIDDNKIYSIGETYFNVFSFWN